MAIVVDEYGSLEGAVTQTDILEAIAEDLPSFTDEADDPEIVQRDDGSLLLDGMLGIDDLREALGFGGDLAGELLGRGPSQPTGISFGCTSCAPTKSGRNPQKARIGAARAATRLGW
jgi:CBS domain containing-hemolysin-like protein